MHDAGQKTTLLVGVVTVVGLPNRMFGETRRLRRHHRCTLRWVTPASSHFSPLIPASCAMLYIPSITPPSPHLKPPLSRVTWKTFCRHLPLSVLFSIGRSTTGHSTCTTPASLLLPLLLLVMLLLP